VIASSVSRLTWSSGLSTIRRTQEHSVEGLVVQPLKLVVRSSMDALVHIESFLRMVARLLRDPPPGARLSGPEDRPEKEAGEDNGQSCAGQFQGGRAEKGKSGDHAPELDEFGPEESVEAAPVSLRTTPITKAIAAATLARCW